MEQFVADPTPSSPSASPPPGEGTDEVLRDLLRSQANARLRRQRAAQALRWGSLLIAASFLFLLRSDLAYWVSEPTPIELGGPLEFSLTEQRSNVYAHVKAVPGPQSANASHSGRNLRFSGLLSTNMVVRQDLGEVGPERTPQKYAQFEVSGRLLRDDDAPEMKHIFQTFERMGVVTRQEEHFWVIRDGERPRSGIGTPFLVLAIGIFIAANFIGARRLESAADAMEAALLDDAGE